MKNFQIEVFKLIMISGKATNSSLGKYGELRFMDKKFIPVGNELRKELLREAHQRPVSVHLGSIKMYRDLKGSY